MNINQPITNDEYVIADKTRSGGRKYSISVNNKEPYLDFRLSKASLKKLGLK